MFSYDILTTPPNHPTRQKKRQTLWGATPSPPSESHALAVVAAGGGQGVDVYGGDEPLALGELQTFNVTEVVRSAGKGTGSGQSNTKTTNVHSSPSTSSSSSSSSLSGVGPYRAVTVSVQSNHGDERFTCIHRIRVLGHLTT